MPTAKEERGLFLCEKTENGEKEASQPKGLRSWLAGISLLQILGEQGQLFKHSFPIVEARSVRVAPTEAAFAVI